MECDCIIYWSKHGSNPLSEWKSVTSIKSYSEFRTQKYGHCDRELHQDARTKIAMQDWMELEES